MINNFWSQAYIASFQIVFDIMAEHWLEVFSDNKFSCFLNFKMPF